MTASDTYIDFLKDQLGGLGPISVRRMFGGAGVFCAGTMFALVADDTLYFKADDGNRADFEAEGLKPFSYRKSKGGETVMSYWRVPERLFDEPDEMLKWAEKALAAAKRSGKPRRKRPAARRS
ncbi:MAG: TfoX/Sxy family protein [Hyphomicrobiaceae bacterium]